MRPSPSPSDGLFSALAAHGAVAAQVDGAAWLRALLHVEGALTRAAASAGLVPQSAAAIADASAYDQSELGRAAQLGGNPVMRLAAREPERVDRLVVLCSSALLGPASAWTDRAALVRADGTAAVASAVVERWLTPDLQAREPELVARLEHMITGTPAEGYAACCEAIAGMDLRADLTRIVAPTLTIAGEQDPATPPEHLAAVADAVAGASALVLPRAAHLASWEQSVAVNAAVLMHLCAPDGDAVRRAAGMRVRRAVLGDAHVDRAVAGTTPLTVGFQDLITRYAWGDVWSRPGLDRRTRSLLTLAVLTALGHDTELAMHVRAAITNGVTPEEVSEVLLHTAVYAGVPAANSAFSVARQVLDGPGASPDERA